MRLLDADNIEFIKDRFNNNEKRLDKLEKQSEEFHKFSTLLELQIELNKKQNDQLEKYGDTMVNINDNLSELSRGYKELYDQNKDASQRIQNLEEYNESKKIDPSVLLKRVITVSIPSVVFALLTAYLVYVFGWKQ